MNSIFFQVCHLSLLHCNLSRKPGCAGTFKEIRTEIREVTTTYTETLELSDQFGNSFAL